MARYVQQCIWCQRARAIVPVRQGKLRSTLHEHDGSVLVDLMGPLSPTKDGHKYILTMFGPFSHYLVAKPISDKRATSVLEAFITHIVLEGRLPSRIALSDGSWVNRRGKVMSTMGQNSRMNYSNSFSNSSKCESVIPYRTTRNQTP